ncbi:MAG TPA: hypothetical protein VGR87_00085 [Candidatus Limnocylindria bacterium]|jgi:hypothetical protein|nr:hypothetical protein [Candidatus Limnocylindria bacterium]
MRAVAGLLVAVLIAGCAATSPPRTPAPLGADIVVPLTVPNGRVEVIVKRDYAVGETVRVTVRLLPSRGSLRGPVDAYVQASGFHGTATVRHFDLTAATATAGSPASVEIAWDQRDDTGKAVDGDDYSLVFTVTDDAGRSSQLGTTLQIR